MQILAGADGVRNGWICITHDLKTGTLASAVYTTAEALIFQRPTPDVLAVDIPIGLGDAYIRQCEIEARALLKQRRSSVFSAPIRAILSAENYDEARRISHRSTGKKPSIQSWNITSKIREVDDVMSRDPSLQERVREAHPEVCFRAWNDGEPMEFPKKKKAGRDERQALVEGYFGAGVCEEIRRLGGYSVQEVGHDDLLDAFAALWTAERIARGEARSLPERPPLDPLGLKMEIVY